MRPLIVMYDQLILLENGHFGGTSQPLAQALEITGIELKDVDINLICPELVVFNRIINLFQFMKHIGLNEPIWLKDEAGNKQESSNISYQLKYPFTEIPDRV